MSYRNKYLSAKELEAALVKEDREFNALARQIEWEDRKEAIARYQKLRAKRKIAEYSENRDDALYHWNRKAG